MGHQYDTAPTTNRTKGILVILTALLALFLMAASRPRIAADRAGVTIRNEKFEVVKSLSKSKEISAFRSIWNRKKRMAPSNMIFHWTYKIDLADGTRWLYDPKGYAQLVSTKKVPVHRVPDARRLNALIGAAAPPR
jgi:hypothetical protein